MKKRVLLTSCFALLAGCAACVAVAFFPRPRLPAPPEEPPDSLWQGFSYDGQYAIEVDQPEALVDQEIAIRVTGLLPGQPVTLRLRSDFGEGRVLESFAVYEAGAGGMVDVPVAVPLYGSYSGSDSMGLFWSMRRLPVESVQPAGMLTETITAIDYTLSAETQGKVLASTGVRRVFVDEAAVVRQPVRDGRLVGTLFYPVTDAPRPTVICLGGSEGGLSEGTAALLASHGYTALALAYFGYETLPPELVEIPLEYFAEAIAWLKTQPAVDPARMAVLGGSKGAELALLLGATYPQDIRAVVAYKPSSVVWMGISTRPENYSQGPRSSWSSSGVGIPFANGGFTLNMVGLVTGREIALRSWYQAGLESGGAVSAVIPVEKIDGPVLLVSGVDDQMWPSTEMGDAVMKRLRANGHPYEDIHLVYDQAGHSIYIPYLPVQTQEGNMLFGGTPEASARASADSWPRVLHFLDTAFVDR
ncbi:MAG: acyl-CoA thioesterase [Chloroflexota bacterium]|nr:MAG: acyl-CoA thioesterase [Chloroflexota bacterium]